MFENFLFYIILFISFLAIFQIYRIIFLYDKIPTFHIYINKSTKEIEYIEHEGVDYLEEPIFHLYDIEDNNEEEK